MDGPERTRRTLVDGDLRRLLVRRFIRFMVVYNCAMLRTSTP